jgi:hypothetical protein
MKTKTKDTDKPKNLTSSSKRPFLHDRRSAPGRELGRSGKKGKPGSGRGGLGAVKKSRSTASIFPGQMITVHVKSRPSKGKSKSFESNTPLQQSRNEENNNLSNGLSREGRLNKYLIKDNLKTITKQYFEELNSYANRMLEESPSEN